MENFLTGFRELFYDEGLKLVDAIEGDLFHLRKGTGSDAMYEHLYWLTQSLKVDASIHGFSEMSDICLRLSLLFDDIRKKKMPGTDIHLEITGRCARFMAGFLENRGFADRQQNDTHKQLVRELNMILSQGNPPVNYWTFGLRTLEKKRKFFRSKSMKKYHCGSIPHQS
ncbi:MAG TPA: hypothetical protein VE870_17480 [Bacteroidales bacterium]|nr:hypothetical protein [Bacteroidales bacterium]